ncbi:MAG: glycerate kinase, partial [Clostridia bacterium]|nr:glycerate kinase [Clostridia bacterium]
MKFVIAMDSFKGSLSSLEAADAVEKGIKKAIPHALCRKCPIADGGEGTVVALTSGLFGELREITVKNPLSRPVSARYGLINQKKTAVIEMSAAAGITLIKENERDPMVTTTYGVGEMILDALNLGCRDFIIGIGGSATNDAGTGMLSALGFEFTDKNGDPVALGAAGLGDICKISDEKADGRLKECSFRVACDVTNPLCGDLGCSAVYGPQKGADKESIALMDKWMWDFSQLAKKYNEKADRDLPGAGAAGGMGFAFTAFLGGSLVSGIDLVMDVVDLEEKIKDCVVVICGEGRLDS